MAHSQNPRRSREKQLEYERARAKYLAKQEALRERANGPAPPAAAAAANDDEPYPGAAAARRLLAEPPPRDAKKSNLYCQSQ